MRLEAWRGDRGAGGTSVPLPWPLPTQLRPPELLGAPKHANHTSISGLGGVREVPPRGGVRIDLNEVRKLCLKIQRENVLG